MRSSTRTRVSNKWLYRGGIVFLILMAGYGWFWKSRVDLLQENLKMLLVQWQSKGYTITYKEIKIGGFPFNVEVIWTDPLIQRSFHPLKIQAQIQGDLVIKGSLWAPSKLVFQCESPTEIIHQIPAKSTLQIGKFYGSFQLFNPEQESNFILEKVAFREAGKELISADVIKAVWQKDYPPEDKLKREAVSLTLDMDEVRLHSVAINQIHLATQLMGAFPLERPKESARQWYQNGGTLEVQDLTFMQKEGYIKFNGTLSLDENLQPLGAMTLEVQGLEHVLNTFFSTSKLSSSFSFMLKEKKNGAVSKPLQFPVTIQDQEISLGIFSLSFFKINWDALDRFAYSS